MIANLTHFSDDEEKVIAERDAALDGSGSSNDWARVASLIDFKLAPSGRDTSRMRKLLIDLKQTK